MDDVAAGSRVDRVNVGPTWLIGSSGQELTQSTQMVTWQPSQPGSVRVNSDPTGSKIIYMWALGFEPRSPLIGPRPLTSWSTGNCC